MFLSQTVGIVVAMLLVGRVPEGRLKRWLHRRAYLITSRILARSLSAVITMHNKQYMPSGGVCVANHTSPIDVIMLSTENCFSLVSAPDTLPGAIVAASPRLITVTCLCMCGVRLHYVNQYVEVGSGLTHY
jgi:1-acyl-sn-glycerol-3-phosphate acyltransferase